MDEEEPVRGPVEDLEAQARRFPRRVAQSLRSQGLLLRELLDCVDALVLVLDPGKRVVSANRGAALFLGYPPGDLAGRRLDSLVAPRDRAGIGRFFADAGRSRLSAEARLLSRDGEELLAAFTLCPLADPGEPPHGYLLVGRAAPRPGTRGDGGSRRFAARMLGGFADPLYVVDARTRTILDCNAAALATFGFEREEVIGRFFLDRVVDRDEIIRRVDRAYASVGIFQERLLVERKAGPPLPCDCTALPILRGDGALQVILVMLLDRSREVRREAELAALVARVSALAAELADLAGRGAAAEPESLTGLGFTRRQVEIARLVAAGATSKDIGFRLGIAESTVKNHLAVMFRKLGTGTRMGFARELAQRGIKLS